MAKTDKQTINEIQSLLKERKEAPQTETVQIEASTKEIAKDVVQELLQQLNKGSTPAPGSTVPAAVTAKSSTSVKGSQTKLKEAETRYTMATMMMKLTKQISILCIIIFTLPFIAVLVTMMDQEMAALIIAMVAMVYPALLFARSLGFQRYLSIKYGLKPLINMSQQQQMIPDPRQQMQQQQPRIPKVPYGIHNQPNQQQKKQNQEFF